MENNNWLKYNILMSTMIGNQLLEKERENISW